MERDMRKAYTEAGQVVSHNDHPDPNWEANTKEVVRLAAQTAERMLFWMLWLGHWPKMGTATPLNTAGWKPAATSLTTVTSRKRPISLSLVFLLDANQSALPFLTLILMIQMTWIWMMMSE